MIDQNIADAISKGKIDRIVEYFSKDDTYIRKAGHQAIGKIYLKNKELRSAIIETLRKLLGSDTDKVRQTAINGTGEIRKADFDVVEVFGDKGLLDHHHSVSNVVIDPSRKWGIKTHSPF